MFVIYYTNSFSKHGMKSTLANFQVLPNAVQRWRRLAGLHCHTEDSKVEMKVREKQLPTTVYNEDFRKEVLAFSEKSGPTATCKKFGVASATIYQWLKHGTQSKLKLRYSAETRSKVVELASKCGGGAAAKAFGLSQPLVASWMLKAEMDKARAEGESEGRKRVANGVKDMAATSESPDHDEKKVEVLKTVKQVGVGKAADLDQLPLATVRRWRDEAQWARLVEGGRLKVGVADGKGEDKDEKDEKWPCDGKDEEWTCATDKQDGLENGSRTMHNKLSPAPEDEIFLDEMSPEKETQRKQKKIISTMKEKEKKELGEKTKSSWSLQRHIREVHLRLRQKKKCPHCPKKISSRCMAGHIKRVH